jgi:signal transduction histidine kinase
MYSTSRSSNNRALEAERRLIARAIHDSITQEIAVVIWQLRMACGAVPQAHDQLELRRTLHLAETTMHDLRDLMRGLRGQDTSDRPMDA